MSYKKRFPNRIKDRCVTYTSMMCTKDKSNVSRIYSKHPSLVLPRSPQASILSMPLRESCRKNTQNLERWHTLAIFSRELTLNVMRSPRHKMVDNLQPVGPFLSEHTLLRDEKSTYAGLPSPIFAAFSISLAPLTLSSTQQDTALPSPTWLMGSCI
jgi:hypothetical protein